MIHFSSVTSYKSTKWDCVREPGVRELSGPVCKVVGQKQAESRHHRGKSALGKREQQAGCSCNMKCGLPETAIIITAVGGGLDPPMAVEGREQSHEVTGNGETIFLGAFHCGTLVLSAMC